MAGDGFGSEGLRGGVVLRNGARAPRGPSDEEINVCAETDKHWAMSEVKTHICLWAEASTSAHSCSTFMYGDEMIHRWFMIQFPVLFEDVIMKQFILLIWNIHVYETNISEAGFVKSESESISTLKDRRNSCVYTAVGLDSRRRQETKLMQRWKESVWGFIFLCFFLQTKNEICICSMMWRGHTLLNEWC